MDHFKFEHSGDYDDETGVQRENVNKEFSGDFVSFYRAAEEFGRFLSMVYGYEIKVTAEAE